MGWKVAKGVGRSYHLPCARDHKSHKCIAACGPATLVELVNTLVLLERCAQFPHGGEAGSECALSLLVGILVLDKQVIEDNVLALSGDVGWCVVLVVDLLGVAGW